MTATKPSPKSMLSLDLGKRRIGLAGCDPLGITVSPLPPLQRKSFERDLKVLQWHCTSRKVEGLVVGLPLDAKGLPTDQARHYERYGQR
ncbi:MAG: Holliday junction resolvase RuvX, partial [Cyanobacteriota bacterium]|nr:Holliday junction resolvase RuvX [Cyanobacteriota bacterium]